MRNLYEVLGVEKSATGDEIKKAWRSLASYWHPDRNKEPQAHERLQEINQAYEILSDADRRAHYDNTGSIADEKSELEQEAITGIMIFLGQALSNGSNNPVEYIRIQIKKARDNCSNRIIELRREIAKLEKIASRVKVNKDTYNLISDAIINQIEPKKKEIESLEFLGKSAETSLQIMTAFSYEEDPDQPPAFRPRFDPNSPFFTRNIFNDFDIGVGKW